MPTMENAHKLELLQNISEIFLTYGLRSTSMDDIASLLRISKKTLYQYFENKDDVVEQVMLYRLHAHQLRESVQELKDKNPIVVINYVKRFVIDAFNSRRPANDFDMKKYHPEVFARIKRAEEDITKEFLSSLLDQGIEQGYFRQNIDRDLQIYLLNTPLRYLGDPDLRMHMKYPIATVVCTILDNFVRAIATGKGLREIEKYAAGTLDPTNNPTI